MKLPNHTLAVLDVGHGNSAVLIDSKGIMVIDSGPGSALLEFLIEQEIKTIDVVLISHADKDHIGGLVALLSCKEFRINCVRLNTDSLKDSANWDDLIFELDRATNAAELDFEPSLTSKDSGKFDRGEVHVQILGPSTYLAAKGPGSTDRNGRRISTNSVSAVIRLTMEKGPIVLLTGDLDNIGLEDLIDHKIEASAPILVFPHHGGRPGASDMAGFTHKLCEKVLPETVVFSIGRGQHSTPQPEIVAAVREYASETRIACTQLSEHCASALPIEDPGHLNTVFSQGREGRKCCSGTIIINLDDFDTILPSYSAHTAFITTNAQMALCMEKKQKIQKA